MRLETNRKADRATLIAWIFFIALTLLAAMSFAGTSKPKRAKSATPLPPQVSEVAQVANAWCKHCNRECHAEVEGYVSGTVCGMRLIHRKGSCGHRFIEAEQEVVGVPVTKPEYKMPPLPAHFIRGTFGYSEDARLTNIQTRLPPMPPSNAEAEIYDLLKRSRDAENKTTKDKP